MHCGIGIDFGLSGGKNGYYMNTVASDSNRSATCTFMSFVTLLAGIALLVSVSYEIITGNHEVFSDWYLTTQLCVCIVFMADFFIRLGVTDKDDRSRYFWRNLPYFLLSVPYLNIIDWFDLPLDREWTMLIGIIPLLRTLVAVYVVVRWFVERGVRRMFTAYAFTVIIITYLAALVFYDYEVMVNARLHGFGNAVWWAFMGMTTVGAEIFPVTAVGKVLAVILPALGMLMLPLFTVYVADLFKNDGGKG